MKANIKEYQKLSLEKATIDKENGIIKNVCVMGSISLNGRKYRQQAMESVAGMLGKSFWNHGDMWNPVDRDLREDLLGRFTNGRYVEESDKVFGDLIVREKHKEDIFDIAENYSDLVGMSIVAHGIYEDKEEDGLEVIKDVDFLFSTDLVSFPATTQSMWEGVMFEGVQLSLDEYHQLANGNGSRFPWHEYLSLAKKEKVWSTETVNALPDTSFGWIAPGGKKNSEGKTTPSTLRHLPFRNIKGSPDLLHTNLALKALENYTDIHMSKETKENVKQMLESILTGGIKRADLEYSVTPENFSYTDNVTGNIETIKWTDVDTDKHIWEDGSTTYLYVPVVEKTLFQNEGGDDIMKEKLLSLMENFMKPSKLKGLTDEGLVELLGLHIESVTTSNNTLKESNEELTAETARQKENLSAVEKERDEFKIAVEAHETKEKKEKELAEKTQFINKAIEDAGIKAEDISEDTYTILLKLENDEVAKMLEVFSATVGGVKDSGKERNGEKEGGGGDKVESKPIEEKDVNAFVEKYHRQESTILV